jgi:hypothetical protein
MRNKLATKPRRTTPGTPHSSPDLRGEQTSQPRCDAPAYLRSALVCACIAAILATPFLNFQQASAHTQSTIQASCLQAGVARVLYGSQVSVNAGEKCFADDGTQTSKNQVALSNIYEVCAGSQDIDLMDYNQSSSDLIDSMKITLKASHCSSVSDALGVYSTRATTLFLYRQSNSGAANTPTPTPTPQQPSVASCAIISQVAITYRDNNNQIQYKCFNGDGTMQFNQPIYNVDAVSTINDTESVSLSYTAPTTNPNLISASHTVDVTFSNVTPTLENGHISLNQLLGQSMTVNEITISS